MKYLFYLFIFLTLTWNDNSGIETDYLVLRADNPNNPKFNVIYTLPPNSTRFIDTTVKKNKRYCYIVEAVNKPLNLGGYTNVYCQNT